jgi:AICAR transformylase/IMP cyclohydrolase PurH
VLVDSSQYHEYIKSLDSSGNINVSLAAKAFRYIADYDLEISDYFGNLSNEKGGILIGYILRKVKIRGELPKSILYNAGKNSF